MTTADTLLSIYSFFAIILEIWAFLQWYFVRCIYGRRYETTTCLRTALTENLTIAVVVALWPLYPVIAIFCPPLWRGMRDAFFGIFELPERHARRGGHTTHMTGVPRRDISDWHRRGWLVLLRARHQRIATARLGPRWRWYFCCSKGDNGGDVFMGVVRPPGEDNDIEGGQENEAHDNAVSQFRQLVIKVVECEEDGVFRSIVGYV